MPVIIVDRGKCKKDKLCILECPMKIIAMNKNNGFPETIENAETLCLDCGHCVAICPHDALSLTTMKSNECESITHEWNPGINVIENYFKSRRSIRQFKEHPVEKEKLVKLLEIASYAPTGHNSRTVEYIVYTHKEEIKKIVQHVIDWMNEMIIKSQDIAGAMHFDMITKAWEEGVDVITHNAPVMIIAHGKKSNPNTPTSCTIALSHIELIAPALKLGCCWAGYISWCAMVYQPLKKFLMLPEGNTVYGTMLLGYPKVRYYRIPKRKSPVEWR